MTKESGCKINHVIQAATVAAVLGLYFMIRTVSYYLPSYSEPAGFILPNIWLLFASWQYYKKSQLNFLVLRGNQSNMVGVLSILATAGSIICVTVIWPKGWSRPAIINCAALLLVIPFAEELFFRGVLLSWFHKLFKRSSIAVISLSLLFGALHLLNGIRASIAAFVLSLALGAITVKTKSLLWPVAIHSGWNSLVILRELSNENDRTIIAAVTILGLAIITLQALITGNKPIS